VVTALVSGTEWTDTTWNPDPANGGDAVTARSDTTGLVSAAPTDPATDEVAAGDPRWQEAARCAEVDPELFFPEPYQSALVAVAICGRCEVRGPCLAYALTHRLFDGVWGGLTARQRVLLARAHRRGSLS